MKITFNKGDKSYSIDYSDDLVWIRTQDSEGWGMNESDLDKLHDAIFDTIDDFFNKHM